MEKIASFTIDHLKLKRGIYVSRKDKVGENVLTSFDIRMKEPYREPVLGSAETHTIEHLAATYLRNSDWKDKVIYWGPMGCMTGNYLILSGDYTSKDIVPLMTDLFEFIADFEGDIPGASAMECGNYFNNNLLLAKYEAREYLKVLHNITEENLVYPE
ncbi:S-ribosylhomocysteine lyase /quorum-sensing autoinducer 2 (AI-2) synthesis protein LuxS [Balneicella halophila]|uniref:S-ribosylhomocysteine lyase n=1 Tax=Balneicella halophila TaxID=1537566 RepID=A0A7L4UMT6_BALHA|nr:S-ribosylhomocysteine lyase [Balneicella halophila]PVX49395.1 S-ribosylhomocysteine lyase /quorum-sensing autoinducer 2 (AI-2) synthesis protein LuxS [Balneicella halophila]